MRNEGLRRIVRIALFIALALIMHFVEANMPPLLPFAPGAKMGLANVISLIALIILGYLDALIIVAIRCFLASLYSGGGVQTLMYSLPAGLMSLAIMIILYHIAFPHISIMAISFIGAIVHNVTQLFVAALIVGGMSVMWFLPTMLLASVIAGLFVGIVGHYVVRALPISVYRVSKKPSKKKE